MLPLDEGRGKRCASVGGVGRRLSPHLSFIMKASMQTESSCKPRLILTIGHSTRSIDVFVRLLAAHGVQCVIDVRTIPRSRHNPQFNRGDLSPALRRAGIAIATCPGWRLAPRDADSRTRAGEMSSFRGYADYMQTAPFAEEPGTGCRTAKREQVALMCAEAVPWRCHRSLIADALLARGILASEITSGVRARPHTLTPFAQVRGTEVTYPGPAVQAS